jgi:hypothetical protein
MDENGRVEAGRGFGTATRVGIAGAIALGAIASGLLLTRGGRRLVGEVWQGRQRTRIEDRVLDALWRDKVLGRRRIDAAELAEGVIALSGAVRSDVERGRALAIAESVKGVREVEDRLDIVSEARSRLRREGGKRT